MRAVDELWRGGTLEEDLISRVPSYMAVFLTRVEIQSATEPYVTETFNITCEDPVANRYILEHLTQTTLSAQLERERFTFCEGHGWRSRICADSENTVLCVDCPQSYVDHMCNRTEFSGNWKRKETDTECDLQQQAAYLGPCQESICNTQRSTSIGQIFMVRSKDEYPPPDISPYPQPVDVYGSTFLHADETSITMKVSLLSPGLVSCRAYKSSDGLIPSSVREVLNNGERGYTVYNTSSYSGYHDATLSISDLEAATHYALYCATVSSLGTEMGYDDMISQSVARVGNITTTCCRKVAVDLLTDTLTSGESAERVVLLKVGAIPEASLQVNIFLTNSSDLISPETSTIDAFISSMHLYYPYTARASLRTVIGTAALNAAFDGTYAINVSLAGESRDLYEVVYPHGSTIQVLSPGVEPSPQAPFRSADGHRKTGDYLVL